MFDLKDEWNPNIITNLNDNLHLLQSLKQCNVDSVVAKANEIKKQHEAAINEFNSWEPDVKKELEFSEEYPPLAFTLALELSKPKALKDDILGQSKIGGLPDLRPWYKIGTYDLSLWEYYKSIGQEIGRKPKVIPLSEILELHWPRCGLCHKPMKYIAQLNMSDWILAIHFLTAKYKEKPKSNIDMFMNSLVFPSGSRSNYIRSSQLISWITTYSSMKRMIFFQCQESHFFNTATHNAAMVFSSEPELGIPNDYLDTVTEFMKRHKIHPRNKGAQLPSPRLQFVEHVKPRFIIDHYNKVDIDSELCKPPKQYLLGIPSSQQTSYRQWCTSPGTGPGEEYNWRSPHRLTPLLTLNPDNYDLTIQISGCLRCPRDEEYERNVCCYSEVSAT